MSFNRYIYTGSVDVTLDIAQDLLRAADQYLLEGLKRLCEYSIAQVRFLIMHAFSVVYLFFFSKDWITAIFLIVQDISLDNVSSMYELSEAFNAVSLRHTCVLFILEQFDKMSTRPGYLSLSLFSLSHARAHARTVARLKKSAD